MNKRTSPDDADRIEVADDLEDVVQDKRAGWRATAAKARRRNRRYQNRLTQELAHRAMHDPAGFDAEEGDDV